MSESAVLTSTYLTGEVTQTVNEVRLKLTTCVGTLSPSACSVFQTSKPEVHQSTPLFTYLVIISI